MEKKESELVGLSEFMRIANRAVYEAQQRNFSLGLKNVYTLNDQIIFQDKDGRITTYAEEKGIK